MFKLVVLLSFIVGCASEAAKSSKLTAAVKDTSVDGIEGLNINLAFPTKFKDYIIGFRYGLGKSLTKPPESLFAKRSFETFADGKLTLDADYSLGDNKLDVDAEWLSDKYGLKIGAFGDTADKVKKVSGEKSVTVDGNKLTFKGAYDLGKKLFSGSASYAIEKGKVELCMDGDEKDPVVKVTRELDESNEITPSVALKSKKVALGYKRKWGGGSLESTLTPADNMLDVKWKDQGANGMWTTTASIPVDNAGSTKISFSHDWDVLQDLASNEE